MERGPQLRAERLAVPPSEKAQEEGLHFHRFSRRRSFAFCQFTPALSSRAITSRASPESGQLAYCMQAGGRRNQSNRTG
jgi:hypothetical protein